MASEKSGLIDNYSTIGYHGTAQESAVSIAEKNFLISRGDDHWLGTGAYFFETGISDGLEDAKKWAKVSAWDNVEKRNKYNVYAVMKAALRFSKLWDLSSKEGLQLFDHSRKQLLMRGLRPGEPTSGRKFDNSVIDFAAGVLKFDGLKAWFFIKLDALSRKMQVQPGIQNVTVLCVRDPEKCISLDEVSREAEGYVNR